MRKLSEFCKFGKMLNDYLRNCLICGLNNKSIQKNLKDLDEALDIARSNKAAYRDTKTIQGYTIGDAHDSKTSTICFLITC